MTEIKQAMDAIVGARNLVSIQLRRFMAVLPEQAECCDDLETVVHALAGAFRLLAIVNRRYTGKNVALVELDMAQLDAMIQSNDKPI